MFLQSCLANTAAAPAKTLLHYDLYKDSLKNVFAIFL